MGDNSPWALIGSYRKHFNESKEEVMWNMSWVNFIMDLATIPSTDTPDNSDEDDIEVVSPEDERAELKKLMSKI